MKRVMIEVRLDGDKVGTGIKTLGYSNDSVSDQFELLGIMENLKNVIQDRIKELVNVKGKV